MAALSGALRAADLAGDAYQDIRKHPVRGVPAIGMAIDLTGALDHSPVDAVGALNVLNVLHVPAVVERQGPNHRIVDDQELVVHQGLKHPKVKAASLPPR